MVAVAGFIIGAILGSFTKATADRISRKEPLEGRSYCQRCKSTLKWYDLFPILSFIFLKGRCRSCHKKIPAGNFWTEIVLGITVSLLFILTVPHLSTGLEFAAILFKLFVISIVSIIFWTDLVTGLIPDKVTYPAIAVTIFYLLASAAAKSWSYYQDIAQNPFGKYLFPPYSGYFGDNLLKIWLSVGWIFLAAAIAAAAFILLIIITRGRGMGWGDVKYVFWIGLAVGFPDILPAVFLAFFTGAVFSLGLILVGRKRFGQTVPFGPFLGIGAVLALLWGNNLISLYF